MAQMDTSDKNPPYKSAGEQMLEAPGTEAEMDVKPDYGYDTYKGTGKLEGKTALLTGADSGIGRAIALAFAREGCSKIAISYLNEHEDAELTKKVCEEAGAKVILLPGNLSEGAQCNKIVDDTVQQFGTLDILVLNASYQGEALESIVDISRERLEHTFKTNILAYFSISQAALRIMKDGAAIITVASIMAYSPLPQIGDYACTKGAMITHAKALSQEAIKKGIRVNCIAPGPVVTPLVWASFPPEMKENFGADMAPIGRPAQPKEFGPPAVFLACKDSSYVVGAILGVTGKLLYIMCFETFGR